MRPRRVSECHPLRRYYAKGMCQLCYSKNLYKIRRDEGYPAWAADRRSIEAWCRRLKRISPSCCGAARSKRNRRYRESQMRLYGGRIDTDIRARLRWAMAHGEARQHIFKDMER